MPETNPWIEALYKFGPAACEGVLAALVVARGGARAAPEEPAVPSSWRARPASNDGNTPDPPRPHATKTAGQPGPSTERRAPPFQPVELKLKDFGSPPGPPPSPHARQPAPQAAPERQPASPHAPVNPSRPSQPQSCPAPTAGTIMQSPEWATATASTSIPSDSTISPARAGAPDPVTAASTSPTSELLTPVAATVTPPPPNIEVPGIARDVAGIAPPPAPSSPPLEPQMELDFSPRPPPPSPPPPGTEPSPPTIPGASEVDAMLGAVVRLLTAVVGETVRQSIDTAVERLEQTHARERNALAERFEAALQSQDARLQKILEHQARQHAEDLRTILRDALPQHHAAEASQPTNPGDALEEFQETLRMGFGEVRSALDRHHHALMNLVRTELVPLAQSARAHLNRPEPPRPTEVDAPPAPTAPPSRAGPRRAPPARDEQSSRLNAAIHDDDPEDLDAPDVDGPRRQLKYRPPDDDPPHSHLQEASP